MKSRIKSELLIKTKQFLINFKQNAFSLSFSFKQNQEFLKSESEVILTKREGETEKPITDTHPSGHGHSPSLVFNIKVPEKEKTVSNTAEET